MQKKRSPSNALYSRFLSAKRFLCIFEFVCCTDWATNRTWLEWHPRDVKTTMHTILFRYLGSFHKHWGSYDGNSLRKDTFESHFFFFSCDENLVSQSFMSAFAIANGTKICSSSNKSVKCLALNVSISPFYDATRILGASFKYKISTKSTWWSQRQENNVASILGLMVF